MWGRSFEFLMLYEPLAVLFVVMFLVLWGVAVVVMAVSILCMVKGGGYVVPGDSGDDKRRRSGVVLVWGLVMHEWLRWIGAPLLMALLVILVIEIIVPY